MPNEQAERDIVYVRDKSLIEWNFGFSLIARFPMHRPHRFVTILQDTTRKRLILFFAPCVQRSAAMLLRNWLSDLHEMLLLVGKMIFGRSRKAVSLSGKNQQRTVMDFGLLAPKSVKKILHGGPMVDAICQQNNAPETGLLRTKQTPLEIFCIWRWFAA